MEQGDLKKLFGLPVIVAALGYFVDIYDLLLFSIVRVTSLKSLHVVTEQDLLEKGIYLINAQMAGLLVGGILWGIMGDKRGRLSVLFGSILLYSLANIANGFVTSVDQYAFLRFIAGIGLAGELGAGITLVSEVLPTRLRGYGTTIVASVGLFGAVAANLVAHTVKDNWQVAYFIGGGLGLALLITRISVFESGIFLQVKEQTSDRGNFIKLFTSRDKLSRFLSCIFIGLPIWFVIGILITFSPELAREIGFTGNVVAGDAVMISYLGLVAGDISSGLLSQYVRSRRRVVLWFILFTLAFIVIYLFAPIKSMSFFYVCTFFLGFGVGYWALFVTIAAEQFGTNLRSTVATTVPNFIRGTVVPLTIAFKFLHDQIGIINSALVVGLCTIIISLVALRTLKETFGRDLTFLEKS
ncbi:MAG: MFS transporter [Cyclobacteriaceae bacterium]|nr:MFS transporter [Cyclobacteriaceae bacterium]